MSLLSDNLASYLDEFQKLAAITRWSGGTRYANPKGIGGHGSLGIGEPAMEAARTDFRKWLGGKPQPAWNPKTHAFTAAELKPATTMREALGGVKPEKGSMARSGATLAPTGPAAAAGGTVATVASPKPIRSAKTIGIPKKPSPAASFARKGGVLRKSKGGLRAVASLLRKVV